MGLKKRAVLLITVTALAAGTLTGCGGFKNTETVAVVGETEIPVGVANFYARYQQAMMETSLKQMLGDNMWEQQVAEGKTYEDEIKDGVMDALERLYILEAHMGEYDVSLTDAEKEEIQKTAHKLEEENRLEAKELVSAEPEYVERLLTLLTIQNKMTEAMTKDVNTEVADEEAAQKSMQYVFVPFTTKDANGAEQKMDDGKKAEVKGTFSAFLEDAKKAEAGVPNADDEEETTAQPVDFKTFAQNAGYEAIDASFDKETTAPNVALVKAADALAEGAWTEVIETESGLYAAKVTSLLDREATDKKKESIVSDRKNERFNEIYEGWKKETKTKVNKEVWKKVDFKKIGIVMKQKEAPTK